MMAKKVWKCDVCDKTSNYKGLCRDCTEYDANGSVIKPVAMVRYNADGSVWTPPSRNKPIATNEMLNVLRASRKRKPTRKQMKQINDEIKAMAESEIANADGDFMDLGESVQEEE